MKVPHNNHHSTDMVESIHTSNCCIRNPDSHNSRPEIQPQFPQFRPKSERQNVAWERKSIRLSSMQSKEAFSYIFPSSFHFNTVFDLIGECAVGRILQKIDRFLSATDREQALR